MRDVDYRQPTRTNPHTVFYGYTFRIGSTVQQCPTHLFNLSVIWGWGAFARDNADDSAHYSRAFSIFGIYPSFWRLAHSSLRNFPMKLVVLVHTGFSRKYGHVIYEWALNSTR
jgi:hypothetical protein